MSQYDVLSIRCRCGRAFEESIAVSVNVARNPAVRTELTSGTFGRFECPSCGEVNRPEVVLTYIDPGRRNVYQVRPTAAGDPCADRIDDATQAVLTSAGDGGMPWCVRSVPDVETLRRHLLLEDAGVSPPREAMDPTPVDARPHVDGLDSRILNALPAWFRKRHGRGVSARETDAARAVETEGDAEAAPPAEPRKSADVVAELKFLRRRLRPGVASARAILARVRDLERLSKQRGWEAARWSALEVRYGVGIDGNLRGAGDFAGIEGILAVLDDLPWQDARANAALNVLTLSDDPAGAAYTWSTGTVELGVDVIGDPEVLRRRLVHEIGHGVHDRHQRRIDDWLHDRFGWDMFEATEDGVQAWIEAMGGWPAAWQGPAADATRALWTRRIVDSVVPAGQAAGIPRRLLPPASRPAIPMEELDAAIALGFQPARLLKTPVTPWYRRLDDWIEANGRLFCFNYYYAGLMAMSVRARSYIAYKAEHVGKRPLGEYAAMAPMEFFAEVYVGLRSRASGEAMPVELDEWIRDGFFRRVWDMSPVFRNPRKGRQSWWWATTARNT